jgi:hypothetical protein
MKTFKQYLYEQNIDESFFRKAGKVGAVAALALASCGIGGCGKPSQSSGVPTGTRVVQGGGDLDDDGPGTMTTTSKSTNAKTQTFHKQQGNRTTTGSITIDNSNALSGAYGAKAQKQARGIVDQGARGAAGGAGVRP